MTRRRRSVQPRATLERLAATEAVGGADLQAAAERVSDPELRRRLMQHGADELRHADLLARRAAELRAGAAVEGGVHEPMDLSRGRLGTGVDAHGFGVPAMCDQVGLLEFIATLHVAEVRARAVYEQHRAATAAVDPATAAVFEAVLADEVDHVAYTGALLERWREQGRGADVDAALEDARSSRWWQAWKRTGTHSGAGFARVMFYALYWTVLVLPGLIARRGRRPCVRTEPPVADVKSQY